MFEKEASPSRRGSTDIGGSRGLFEKKKGGMHSTTATEINGKEYEMNRRGSAENCGARGLFEKKKGGLHAAAYLAGGKTGGSDHAAVSRTGSPSPRRKNSTTNVKTKSVSPSPVTFSYEKNADSDVSIARRDSTTKRWASEVVPLTPRDQNDQPLADLSHLSPMERIKEVHTGILTTIETYDTVTRNQTKERERDILLTCQSTIKSVEEVTRRKIAKEFENKISHDGCNIEIRSLAKELKIVKTECGRLMATNDRLTKELANLRRFKVTYETEMQLVLGSIGRLRIRNRILNRKLKAFTDPSGTDGAREDEETREEEEERACDELEWEALNAETSQKKWNISTLSSLLSSPSTDPSFSSMTRPASAAVARDTKDPHAQCKADLAHMRAMFAKEATIKRAVIKECNDRAATAVPILRLLRACVKEVRESEGPATGTERDLDVLDAPDVTSSDLSTNAWKDSENRLAKDNNTTVAANPSLLFSTRLAQDRRVLEYMALITRQASRPYQFDRGGTEDMPSSSSSDDETEREFLPANVLPLADLVANSLHEKKKEQKSNSTEPLLWISGEHQQPMPRSTVRPKSAPDTSTKSLSCIRFTVADDIARTKTCKGVRSIHQDGLEDSPANAPIADTSVASAADVASKDERGLQKDLFFVTGSSISRPSTAKTKR